MYYTMVEMTLTPSERSREKHYGGSQASGGWETHGARSLKGVKYRGVCMFGAYREAINLLLRCAGA